VLMATYFIGYCYVNKYFLIFKEKLIIFLLIFYLYININSFFGYLPLVSFKSALPYIRMILFSVFVCFLLIRIANLKRIIFFSFLLSYLILFIDSLIQLTLGQNILGFPMVDGRIASLFRDKLVMGSYVSRTLPILIAISYFESFKYRNFFRDVSILLGIILVFFSAERISFIYLITTIFLYLILLNNKKKLFLCLGLLVSIFFVLNALKPSSFERLYKHTLLQMKNTNFYGFSERHEMHIITAYRMFLEKKFIGHGINSFRHLCDKDPYSTEDLIIQNNQILSPINGYYYLKKKFIGGDALAYFVPEKNKLEFEKYSDNLQDALASNDVLKIRLASESFDLFLKKNNLLQPYAIRQIILKSINSPSPVKKGDFVISNSEFKNGCSTHPHNFHLQILSELGLFGYIFFLIFFIYLIFIFFKSFVVIISKKSNILNKNYNLFKIFIILALIQSLFPLAPSGNFFNNWLSVFLYFKLGFLLTFYNYNRK